MYPIAERKWGKIQISGVIESPACAKLRYERHRHKLFLLLTCIIMQLFDIVEPSLLSKVNKSVAFPAGLKHALVIPSLKKLNLNCTLLTN